MERLQESSVAAKLAAAFVWILLIVLFFTVSEYVVEVSGSSRVEVSLHRMDATSECDETWRVRVQERKMLLL